MITGNTKTEAMYRAVEMDSSSSLKDFSMDRNKYYRKYILKEKIREKEIAAATMGKIVETLLFEPEEFDNRFYMSTCDKTPTGMMLDFVEALYRNVIEATDENGVVNKDFKEMCQEAYVASGYKIKFDAVMSKFVGSEAEQYFNERLEVEQRNLIVITTRDVSVAEKIVEELKTNPVTSSVINKTKSARYDVFNQYQIEGYEVDGLVLKSMLDKLIIDHDKKEIFIYDLKCTWSVENFIEEYYLYRRAFIQGYVYYKAVLEMIKNSPELKDYFVYPPTFIVCDSANYYNPLMYNMTEEDLEKAYNGFVFKGRTYEGVQTIIKDLKWAKENDVWKISRTNHNNKGVVNISDVL